MDDQDDLKEECGGNEKGFKVIQARHGFAS
jgi:hypothetical protein